MIPDITLHVFLGWVSVGTLESKGYMPLIISELFFLKTGQKTYKESYFVETTHEEDAQTRKHGDGIQQLASNQFPTRFNGHLSRICA